MEIPVLNMVWFILLGVLLAGYAILDGFDLGVGIVHLAARSDRERRTLLNAIGPLWDGNEVWLVAFGGGLFAAFPHAYAAAFSAFYLPLWLLLLALIGRAVSVEFRSKLDSARWRRFFDAGFCASSTLAALLFGLAVGKTVSGLKIGPDGEYQGTFFDLLGVFPILLGLLVVALFAMHGTIYLHLKTASQLQQSLRPWRWTAFGCFLVIYAAATLYALVDLPVVRQSFQQRPWQWIIVVLNLAAVAGIPIAFGWRRAGYAFLCSCVCIAMLVLLLGLTLYPNLLLSSLGPTCNLNVFNSASSPKTLGVMTIIAAVGLPLVFVYTAVVYWTFRGKVQSGETGY